MKPALAVLALLLTSCQTKPDLRVEPAPKIVRATVEVPVSLCPKGGSDCELLRDCYNEPAKEQTYNEAKRLANLRDASIDECNKRWARVRAAQPARPTVERKGK